jgi:predicted HTH transcriptional regulator
MLSDSYTLPHSKDIVEKHVPEPIYLQKGYRMNTEEIEALLDGAEESDVLEFKTAMDWNQSLIRDILAMANVQDGGRIVVGVADQTYDRVGLSAAQIATYDLETMQDRVSAFADPRVEFRVDVAADRNGLQFVVIDVRPFETVPVVCRRDGADLNEGDIYYRSRSGRPASARVQRSADMRDIIEVAITRSRQRLTGIGLVPPQNLGPDYDEELGGL